MQKLLKTFWRDNRNFFLIITLVFVVATILLPISVFGMQYMNSGSGLFEYVDAEATLIFLLVVAVWVIRGIMIPGLAIFLAVRTQTGLAKQRYQMITTARWQFGLLQIATILLLSLLYSLLAVCIITTIGLIFGVDLGPLLYDSEFSSILSVVYSGLNFDSIMLLPVGILRIVNSFLFWQLIFILPQTKILKAMPKIGMIFTIIGGFLGMYFLQFILFLFTLFNTFDNYLFVTNISTTVISCIGLFLYFYALEKQIEI